MIVEGFFSFAEKFASKKIKDIRVGIGYISFLLDDSFCCLAFKFKTSLDPAIVAIN
jgi:hypothetical protein